MNESIKISMEINKTDLLKMLSTYYSEKLGKEVNVKANVTSSLNGYGREYSSTDVEIYFEREESIGNIKIKIKTSLTEEDVKSALNEIIEKLNYSIESVNYKAGTRTVGDFRDEYEEAYFNGVTLNLRQKGIERKLI